jgi:hypothetical protein
MKKIIPRILGVALTFILLSSLFIAAVPASAGTLTWSAETIISTSGNRLASEDIKDLAVAPDGTYYAVCGTSKNIYKSTNSGDTWTKLAAITGVGTSVTSVAAAPDVDDFIAVIADSNEVYISTNGGTSFSTLGTVQQSGYGAASSLVDIAISPTSASKQYVAVAGNEGAGAGLGNVWYFDKGSAAPVWKETATKDGAASGVTASEGFHAVEFSPNFASDLTMVAVSGPTGTADTAVNFQIWSKSSRTWNTTAGFAGYPVTVDTLTAAGNLVNSASIALPTTYLGADESERKAFVGLSTDCAVEGGIFRLSDTAVKVMKDTVEIRSVAYNTNDEKLVAGRYDSNLVYRCSNPLATSPTISSASTYKRPGNNTTSTKAVVAWDGDNVVAVTDGDESAFSVSMDDGKCFNDLSLIDTTLTNIRDVEVSADGAKVYMVTDDGTDLSVFRKASSWQRILAIQDTNFFVRISPANPDIVYVADKGGTAVYYSNDAGELKWWLRYCGVTPVDLAIESDDVAYALSSAGSVTKTTNGGFIWGSAKATGLSGGATIVSLSEDNLIVGSNDGYVAYSTDGNDDWTLITPQVNSSSSNVHVAATGLADGDFVYAASDAATQDVRRWEIGTSTSWSDIISGTLTWAVKGLVLHDGVLYTLESNGTDSDLHRTLSPSTAGSTTGWSCKATTDADDVGLAAEPRALKVSSSDGVAKLWAVKTNGTNKVYSLTDSVALTAPELSAPADEKDIPINPVTGRSMDISFTWLKPSDNVSKYDLEIAFDDGFTEKASTIDVSSTSSTVAYIVGPFGTTAWNICQRLPTTGESG